MKKYIVIGIVLVLGVIQFFPIDKTNPESDPSLDFRSVEDASGPQADKLVAACYDCHSNQTEYPWYSSVAPVSWWLNGHIENGRNKLNLSLWGNMNDDDRRHALEEMQEEVEEKHMPLTPYMWTHPDGKMSDEDRTAMIAWLGTIAAGPLD